MIDNPGAVYGIKQILSSFADQDVISLCATVTQGFLKNKIQTREAAIEAILKYSPDAMSILKRKLLTRNHLFEYLDSAGIEVQLPVTKDDLIDNIIEAWDPKKARIETQPQNETVAISQESNMEAQDDTTAFDMACIQQSSVSSTSISMAACSSTVTTSIFIDEYTDYNPNDLEAMALAFSTWFYTLLNRDKVIAYEHFYRNSSVQIHLLSEDNAEYLEVLNNGENVANLLYEIRSKHNLYFNANVETEGMKIRMDRHGVVMIMCCGTLHIEDIVSGVFEQLFSLARDPTCHNNWKIQSTSLVLRSKSNVTGMPRLGDEIRLLKRELL